MKAILKKYFQEFAEHIEFPTLIYTYETEKVITYNSLARKIMGRDMVSITKVVRVPKIDLEEIKKNQGSKIFYNVYNGFKDGNYSEVDIELNVIELDGKHIIVAFFDYSYKQVFVSYMKGWLPRFAWKDNKRNFLGMNQSFLNDVKLLGNINMPVRTQDIMDAATSDKLEMDDEYVMNGKVPLMKVLQLMKSDTSEGYFCSIDRIPLINSNGSVAGLIGSYRLIFDHDDQKRMFDSILRSYNTLSELISRSDTVIISWRKDITYHIEYVSSNVSNYGYHPDLFYEKKLKVSELIWEEDYKKLLKLFYDLENGSSHYFEKTITIYKYNGETALVNLGVSVIKRLENEIYYECHVQSCNSDINTSISKKHMNSDNYHLALDTWTYTKKQEELTKAVTDKCKEFTVHYQPIVDVRRSSVIGVEALLRWNSPNLDKVKPIDFFSMSEYVGLTDRLGSFSIREALKTHGLLRKNGIVGAKIHINLSLVQLLQPNFLKQLIDICDRSRVSRDEVVLEIKEGLAIEDLGLMKKALLELKQLGFAIALDNFGAGFIDVHSIMDIPFDYIKLDKRFMEFYGTDKFNGALVVAMIDMIKSMKTEIIVTGIETIKQYEFLLFHEVPAYQGFLFSKPVERKKLISMLK